MSFLTVISRRELARARVLGRSVAGTHPGEELQVLVFDDPAADVAAVPGVFDVVRVGDLDITLDDYKTMATIYSGSELRRALVPWAMEAAATRRPGPVVVVPPDLWVLDSLAEVIDAAADTGLAVVPRMLLSGASTIAADAEADMMNAGVHDDTFFAVSGDRVHDVVAWMKRQLSRHGIDSGPNLIDQAASYWQAHAVLDPGVGLAIWNSSQRSVDRSPDGGWLALGVPVRAVRMAGVDPERVRDKTMASSFGLLAGAYVAELDREGGILARHPAAETDIGSDEVFIHAKVREVARQHVAVAERTGAGFRLPDPFGEAGGRGLSDWAEAAAPHTTKGLNAWALPRGTAADERGINVVGFSKSENGVGDMTRLLIEMLEHAGIAYRLFPYSTHGNSREDHPFDLTGDTSRVFDTNVVVLNADWLDMWAETHGSALLADRRTIGYWAWETETFPAWMAQSDRWVDEVWALSTFAADAIRPTVGVPVHPLILPVRHRPEMVRADGYDERPYTFFFSFDFNSIYQRKNPRAIADAFCAAFAPGEAELVIKSINGRLFPKHLADLQAAGARHPDIDVYDGFVDHETQQGLLSGCDCYVSLHRAEGYGLTVAEAMAFGKPVIVSDYSGSLDFTTNDCAFLVPTDRSEIPWGAQPYLPGTIWGEPDVEAASAIMRWVRDHPMEAAAVGQVGREHVRNLHTTEVRARDLEARLASFWARTASPVPAPV